MFVRPTQQEIDAQVALMATSWDTDKLDVNHSRLQPLYGMRSPNTHVSIRLLCWHVISGPWVDDGNTNRLVHGNRQILAFASGFPLPSSMGVSVHELGKPLYETPLFQEVIQAHDILEAVEQFAWLASALRRAALVLYHTPKADITRAGLLMGG